MPRNWWTRKNFVLAAAVVALALIGFVVIGVSYPEPAASAALGPDWQCSRLAFVFTTCSRVKTQPVHGRPRRQNPGVRTAADVIGSGRKRSWQTGASHAKTVSC